MTEKLTNNIDAFHIQVDGTLGPIVINPSVGPGAFAVLFAPNGAALVSETGPTGGHNAAAISSYAVAANGTLSAVSASVPTLGAATCWQAVTPDGRFVYTSNSGSSTISGFSIAVNGALTPLFGMVVATLPSGSINLDIAISADGKFLFTLNSGTGTIIPDKSRRKPHQLGRHWRPFRVCRHERDRRNLICAMGCTHTDVAHSFTIGPPMQLNAVAKIYLFGCFYIVSDETCFARSRFLANSIRTPMPVRTKRNTSARTRGIFSGTQGLPRS